MGSDAEVLRFIARHEALQATLDAFPDRTRESLAALLESAASRASNAPTAPPAKAPPASTPSLSTAKLVRVYSDGAARGNPGPAGAGAVITDAQGRILERLGKFLGRQTNNFAEYQGVLLGLTRAHEMGAREVEVYADSELMIRQLGGQYKVKSESLRPLYDEAVRRLREFDRVRLVHVPREMNRDADEMSNRAIDERM